MLDNEQQVETPVIENVEQAPDTSIRDSIKSTIEDIKTRESGEEPKEKPAAIKEAKPDKVKPAFNKEAQPTKEFVENKIEEKPIKAPESLPASMKAKWGELPREVQQAWANREEEVHKGFTKHDEERIYAKQIKEVMTPYQAMIRAEGGSDIGAIKDLMNTAYLLRTKNPQEKGQILLQIARQYGADLSQAMQAQQSPQVPAYVQQLEQKLARLEQGQEQVRLQEQQKEQAAIQQQIDAFAADTENYPHFESVKAHMGVLLQGGLAKDLQDAYDQAVYARPDIRSTLLESQSASNEAKRVAEAKAKADAARKAGSSIKGAPGMTAPKDGVVPNRSLREELRVQLRNATG